MTKKEIIKIIVEKTGIEKNDVQIIIEGFLQIIIENIEKKQKVKLHQFGTFFSKKRAQKIARDIKKNTSIIIPECYFPVFKPSKSLISRSSSNA